MVRIYSLIRLKERRKELRKRATAQENLLWDKLRNRKLGVKFRRQHNVSGYILDFYCKEKKLIIELDGGVHKTKEAKEYDKVRDKFFTGLGYKVLRFWNREIDTNIRKVLISIQRYL